MAFGISRRTNRASSSGKSLSDLYDDARTEAIADQPLDRIRQEIFVEMARRARARDRRRIRQALLDALWVTTALLVALGVSAYYLDIVIGAVLPLGRPLASRSAARLGALDGRERAPGRQASERPGSDAPLSMDRSAAAGLRSGPAGAAEEVAAELQERLQSWIATLNARDIARLKGFYAPTMSAFYRARHVSREFALADKADQFRRAEVLNVRADAADIALPPDGQSAALTFRKRYEIRGGGLNRVGEVVSELRWAKGASGWMITSERDLEIR